MDTVDSEFLLDLVAQKYTTAEISNKLKCLYPRQRGFSERSVHRALADLQVTRRNYIADADVDVLVQQSVEQIGPEAGRRYVKGFVVATGGPTVSEIRIGNSLKRMYPDIHTKKLNNVNRQLNPHPYHANYFGHRLHMDQNEKLFRYGVTHVACIDGYSGFVPGFAAMPVKNNIVIYEDVFRKITLEYGLWDQIIVDQGKEFNLTLAAQQSLAAYRRNTTTQPFRQVKSTQNNRIERFWVETNSRINYPIKNALIRLEDNGKLNIADDGHRFCCSTISCRIAKVGLSKLVASRNHHCVQKKGVPIVLMQKAFNTAPVGPEIIMSSLNAAASYRLNGGSLTDPGAFGQDPLAGNIDRIQARDYIMDAFPYSLDEIYGSTVNGEYNMLQNYYTEFLRASM